MTKCKRSRAAGCVALVVLCVATLVPAAARAQAAGTDPATQQLARFWTFDCFVLDGVGSVVPQQRYDHTQLAKAPKDECFNGVGATITFPVNGVCATGTPKVNDAYVWGLTKQGKYLFFGTLANVMCGVESGYLEVTDPQVTSEWVCEFGQSKSGAQGLGTGDHRWPNLFRYDLVAKQLVSLNPTPNTPADILRKRTSGFRSAGSLNGVAFVAGMNSGSGLNFFAFDADTGNLIGAPTTIGQGSYNNIRQWAIANGQLYLGVGTTTGGAVLRWTGTRPDPYHFVVVGYLPSDAANMVAHDDGRLYITTWPNRCSASRITAGECPMDYRPDETPPAGLYRSPVLPETGGLPECTDASPDGPCYWGTPLWLNTRDDLPAHANVPFYDPDQLTGYHSGGGALASYKGRLYFGTMHVPQSAATSAAKMWGQQYGVTSTDSRTMLGTQRAISIFEVKFPAGKKVMVSMLFGEKYLPTFDPATGGYSIAYDEGHRTGFEPRFGPSGLGNFFNNYTWAMRVFKDKLVIGTMDWSHIARVNMEAVLQASSSILKK